MSKKIVNEEVKPIILRDDEKGVTYTLEFNRESIKFAEMRGFDIDDLGKYPMSKMPELFFYAFRMHHKNVSREKTDKILFDDLGGMQPGMIERLAMLYAEPFKALTPDEDEAQPKNSHMTVEM